ncbi:unnamed protein product [Eruca vesicaria subsp. sativa]|uniref:Uncharacterized protein n=1 Tax=Eruca vesicaria subsp. sativa TaxID=29727 RepID=A0ABC8KVJ6_ERUVS|nr:unnamed protein product [Eruca vesicaria subsp. sativa]
MLLVSLGVNLVKPLFLPTAGCRFQIYNFVCGKLCFFSPFLCIIWKGMTSVTCLNDSKWDGRYLRFGFLVLSLRIHLRQLPQYEDLMLLVSHCLTQYEAVRHLFYLTLPYLSMRFTYLSMRLLFQISICAHYIIFVCW